MGWGGREDPAGIHSYMFLKLLKDGTDGTTCTSALSSNWSILDELCAYRQSRCERVLSQEVFLHCPDEPHTAPESLLPVIKDRKAGECEHVYEPYSRG